MAAKSNYWSEALLNRFFNAGAFTFPATMYLALYTVAPTASTAGTEATGTSYARAAVTANTTNWPTISSGQTMTSGAAFTFPQAGGDWSSGANMVAMGILDSAVGGSSNLFYFGTLTEAKPIFNLDTASFASGALTVSET